MAKSDDAGQAASTTEVASQTAVMREQSVAAPSGDPDTRAKQKEQFARSQQTIYGDSSASKRQSRR